MVQKTVFTRSAITPSKVNQFRWSLEQCEPNVGGWPWQIFGAIRSVATVWEAVKFFAFVINNVWYRQFPVGQILRHLNTTRSIDEAVKTFGTEFWKFHHKGSLFKKMQKLLTKFPGPGTSGRHNSAMITDRQKFTSKLSTGCLVPFSPLESLQSLPWAVRSAQERTPTPNLCDFHIIS